MLDSVCDALSKAGVQGLTVTEVKRFGRRKWHTLIYRGAECSVDFVHQVEQARDDEPADMASYG